MSTSNAIFVPAEIFAIAICADSGEFVVGIRRDGSVKYGLGFTADPAAREFWAALSKSFPGVFNNAS